MGWAAGGAGDSQVPQRGHDAAGAGPAPVGDCDQDGRLAPRRQYPRRPQPHRQAGTRGQRLGFDRSDPAELALAIAHAAPALAQGDPLGHPAVAQQQARLELERPAGEAHFGRKHRAEGADVADADPGELQVKPHGSVSVKATQAQADRGSAARPGREHAGACVADRDRPQPAPKAREGELFSVSVIEQNPLDADAQPGQPQFGREEQPTGEPQPAEPGARSATGPDHAG